MISQNKKSPSLVTMFLFMVLVTANQPLVAGELQIEILKANQATLENFSKDLTIVAEDAEGLSTIENENSPETGNEEHPMWEEMIPADEYERQVFNVGEYVIICFTPPITLHMQLWDTAPNGRKGRIFPVDGTSSRKVRGGIRYCVGDENSDTILEMDKNSGTGNGRVLIVGTSSKTHADALKNNGFSLPEVGEAYKSAAGSKMIGRTKVEGWIEYEVQ